MMNPEIKQEWVKALRSGKFFQATGALSTGGGYCCLGVLCEIAVEKGVVTKKPSIDRPGLQHYGDPKWGSASVLPKAVKAWSGIDDQLGLIDHRAVSEDELRSRPASARVRAQKRLMGLLSLAELNDNGFTFAEIADIIEKYL
jgi:hypothetical protein